LRDFTLKKYKQLLEAALAGGYTLTSYHNYILNNEKYNRVFILRQDVDKRPGNSLQTALLQNELGATASYYFRIVKQSFNPAIIEKIAKLGHEIGYHYEEVATENGNIEKAYSSFQKNLEHIRKYYPVKTICMHGSPFSKWDNRLLWKKYDYRTLGIIGEPYFDLDFNKVLYITDTGRKWNGDSVSVRDKVNSNFDFSFSSTSQIITSLKNNELPDVIMQNIHPQRWNDNYYFWTKELVVQNVKNIVKSFLVKNSDR